MKYKTSSIYIYFLLFIIQTYNFKIARLKLKYQYKLSYEILLFLNNRKVCIFHISFLAGIMVKHYYALLTIVNTYKNN